MKTFAAILIQVLFVSSAAYAEGTKTMSTLSAVFASPNSQQCTFEKTGENPMKGTVYTSSGRMRGDFTVTDPSSGEMEVHMLRTGQVNYTWGGPFGNKGIKTKLTNAPNVGPGHGPNFDESVELDCRPWQKDESVLSVPADVQFQDMAAMMDAPSPEQLDAEVVRLDSQPDFKQMQCAACDGVGDEEARKQCLDTLGCA